MTNITKLLALAESTQSTKPRKRRVPPDPERKNDDRSEWAQCALQSFQDATGSDLEDCISDLIANLGHFCDRNGMSLEAEIRRAAFHYEEETGGKGKQLIYTP